MHHLCIQQKKQLILISEKNKKKTEQVLTEKE